MPETQKKQSWLQKLFSNMKTRFSKKHPLDDLTIETEMIGFMKEKGYTTTLINEDMASFQEEFVEYLKSKNYDVDDYNGSTDLIEDADKKPFKMPRIRAINEDLNVNRGFKIFYDTTVIMPGLVCYVVEKIEPTNKIPYTTYKPSPRIIVSVHNTGVNGGTVFITYEHKLSGKTDFQQKHTIISEYEVIYSPLTKEHAEYICKLLNFQSRQTYKQAMIKINKQKSK